MEVDAHLGDSVAEPNAVDHDYTQLEDDPLGYNPQLKNTHYDPELRDDRRAGKKKLKRRFEHIFDKYERDFEGIGDEIDIKTGEIVVDNGHLQRMQNEQDVGNHALSDSVDPSLQVLEDGAVVDISERRDINGLGNEDDANDDVVSDDEESSFEDAENGNSSAAEEDEDSATSPFDADESALEDETSLAAAASKPSAPTTFRNRSVSGTSSVSRTPSHSASSQLMPDDNILNQVPGLKDSLLNLQSKYKRGETVDADAIQALGMSIANQLTNFISRPSKDQSRHRSKRSKDATWSFPRLPEDEARKRRLRSPSPPLEDIELPTSGKKSIWAPIRHPRQQKRRRMKERERTQPLEQDDNDTSYPPPPGDTSPIHFANRTQDGQLRVCANCQSSDSDVWRKGPNGDLCNTCGMYLYRYGLMRPLESTPDPVDSEDTEAEVDPLERDWWLAAEKAHSTERKEVIKPVGVKNSHFVVEEDALIIQLKEIDLLSWERMATYFPGRSAYALQCRYSKKLHGRAPKARDILLEQGYRGTPDANGTMVFSYTREPFKEEEDELLLKLRDEDGLDFDAVSESLPGRSPEVLEIRYNELVKELLGSRAGAVDSNPRQRPASREGSQPLARNARYSAEEDAKIVKLREIDKLNWAKIAEQMAGRNSFSLQKRYIRELCGRHSNSTLAPRKAYNRSTPTLDATRLDGEVSDSSVELNSLSNTRYSAEEDAILLDLRESQGLTWEEIDPKMPGRSRSSLKNRYNYLRDRRPTPAQFDGRDSLSGPAFNSTNDISHEAMPELETTSSGLTTTNDASGANIDSQINHSNRSGGNVTLGAERTSDSTMPGQSFTQSEDDLVLKLRELESLPWPDIALQLPGKTVSSISERYYHFLLPRKLNIASHLAVNDAPGVVVPQATSSHGGKSAQLKRWTTEEDSLLLVLREQGKTWEQIAARLPGRTSKAARIHHAAIFHTTEKASPSQDDVPSDPSTTTKVRLLQQAVGNLRRMSESAPSQETGQTSTANVAAETASGSDRPRGRPLLPKPPVDNGARTAQISDGQAQASVNTSNQLPVAVDQHSKTPLRTVDNFGRTTLSGDLNSNETPRSHAHPYLQTPFTQAQTVRQSSEPTPVATAFYATPARHNPHGHPYFVHLPATYPLPPPVELPAPKPAIAKMPAAKRAASQPKARKQDTNKRQSGSKNRSKSRVKPHTSGVSEHIQAKAIPIDTNAVRSEVIDEDSVNHESPDEDVSASESGQESWHESQNQSESEEEHSDSTEAEPEMRRATMTIDPDSADDELLVDNSVNDTLYQAAVPSPTLKPNETTQSVLSPPVQISEPTPYDGATPSPSTSSQDQQGEADEDQQPQSEEEEEDFKQLPKPAKPAKPKTYDIEYVNAHPDETFCHRGNGRWIRGPPPPPKPEKVETFDIAYVNAHPAETFRHRGRGRWIRGSPPPPKSEKPETFDIEYVNAHHDETFRHRGRGRWVRGPPLPDKPEKAETFDIEYVNAHPNETFHHRGHGRWARGLPGLGEEWMAISGPEHTDKTSTSVKEDLVSTTYVDAHPDETFHHRGRGLWARGLPPIGDSGKFPIRGPEYNGKVAIVREDDSFDAENVESPALVQVTDDGHTDKDDVRKTAESDETSKAKRPPVSNTQLLVMALESNAPEPMFLPDIYRFIEGKFEYFQHETSYRNGIRATLSNQPHFTKASTAFKSGWILTGPSAIRRESKPADVATLDVLSSPSASRAQGLSEETRDTAEGLSNDKDETTPVHSTRALSSDKLEEPSHEIGGHLASKEQIDNYDSLQIDSSEISIGSLAALHSSPSNLSRRLSPPKPSDMAVTPGTDSSTLFSHVQQSRSVGRSTPIKTGPPVNRRISSIARLGNRKRIVHTPMREVDDSEDELA